MKSISTYITAALLSLMLACPYQANAKPPAKEKAAKGRADRNHFTPEERAKLLEVIEHAQKGTPHPLVDWVDQHPTSAWKSNPYPVPGPKNPPVWAWNNLGITETPPAPFLPIVQSDKTLSIWGRTIETNETLLPTQVTSQKMDLFSSPPSLELVISGKPISLTFDAKDQSSLSKVTWARQKTIAVPGGTLTLSNWMDYAGLFRWTLQVSPDTPIQIDRLVLKFPLHTHAARYVSLPTAYNFQTHSLDFGGFTKSFHLMREEKNLKLPWNWGVLIAGPQVGLNFLCPTSTGWSHPQEEGALTFTQNKDHVDFEVQVVQSATTLAHPFDYTFGFMTTPSKPLPKDDRSRVFHGAILKGTEPIQSMDKVDPEKHTQLGIQWSNPKWGIEGYAFGRPSSDQPEIYKNCVDYFADQKIRRLVYTHLRGFPAFDQGAPQRYWKVWGQDYPAFLKSRKEALVGKGNWLKGDPWRLAEIRIHFETKSIVDYALYQRMEILKKHRHGGTYFDIAPPYFIKHNKALGIPYPGQEDRPWFDVWGRYQFYKRFYTAAKAWDPNHIIMANSHKLPPMLGAFLDVHLCGEGLSSGFWTKAEYKHKFRKNFAATDQHYRPDYTRVPGKVFEAGYLQTLGYRVILLPQISKWNNGFIRRNKEWYTQMTWGMLACTLPWDTPSLMTRHDMEVTYRVYRAFDQLGKLDGTETYRSPLDLAPMTPANTGLQLAAYQKENKVLLIVSNPTDKALSQIASLKLGTLDLNDKARFKEILKKEGNTTPTWKDGSLSNLRLAPGTFSMFLFEKN